jgi:NitT/TauT family transport system permease protein
MRKPSRLLGLIVPVLLLTLWHVLAVSGYYEPAVLPSPAAVVKRWLAYMMPPDQFDPAKYGRIAWAFSGEMGLDALSSLHRIVTGFVIGAGLALPLGLVMGASRTFNALFDPLVQFLRPIPPIAYIPLSMLWFGLGNPPAVFIITIGAFFPVLLNTISGVQHVDAIYIRAAHNMGAGPFTLFWRVILPAATPYILTGCRVGIGTAFICVIVAEMVAVNNGVGYRILEAREYLWSDKVIAGMFTIGLMGLAIDLGMSRLNRYLLRWHRGLES